MRLGQKKKKKRREAQKKDIQGECQVMTEAEIRVMQLQVKQSQGLTSNYQKLGRGQEGFSPTGFPLKSLSKGHPANTLILDF